MPGLTRLAVVWNREGATADAVRALEAQTKRIGVEVLSLEVREAVDIPGVVASARSANAQGIVQLPSPLLTKNRKLLVDAAAREKLPMMCEERVFVEDGCLMTYSANYVAMARRLADYVDRILRGAKAADLPVEQPREFEFVINQRTAQALGITISSTLQVQATEVIR
jgi:putative ABC transport system substrate-binding protein